MRREVGIVAMKIEPLARLERHAKRIGDIVTILGRYGLADLFGNFDYPWLKQWLKGADGQVLSDLTTPQRVRRALTEMGTTFIKLGQMLSTRADLIGIDLANELASLQSNVPPDPAQAARTTIKAALEKGVGELFARRAGRGGVDRAGAPGGVEIG